MATYPDRTSKLTPSGEFFVIMERDGEKRWVVYQTGRGKFVFAKSPTPTTSIIRFIQPEAELIAKTVREMGKAGLIEIDNVYIREIGRYKKGKNTPTAKRLLPEGTTDIISHFYTAPIRLKEVTKVEQLKSKNIVATRQAAKMVEPKASTVIVDNSAVKKTVTNSVPAESPKQIFDFVVKPYTRIKDMPIMYVYNSIMQYFNSCVAEVLDKSGNVIDTKWVNIPERRGLALALGCSIYGIEDFITRYERENIDLEDDYSDNGTPIDENPEAIQEIILALAAAETTDKDTILDDVINTQDNIQNSKDNNAVDNNIPCNTHSNDTNNLSTNNNSYPLVNKNSYSLFNKSNYSSFSRKRLVYTLIKRALDYIEYYKVKCLYGSSPVGAMFDLKCNYGWQEKSTVTIEAGQSVVGRQRSEEELAKMAAAVDIGGGSRVRSAAFDLDGVAE